MTTTMTMMMTSSLEDCHGEYDEATSASGVHVCRDVIDVDVSKFFQPNLTRHVILPVVT